MSIVNTRGCTLRTGKENPTMVCVGPITRYASDLLPLLKVLTGPTNANILKLDKPVDVRKLKYYYIRQNGELRCSVVSGDLQHIMTKYSISIWSLKKIVL